MATEFEIFKWKYRYDNGKYEVIPNVKKEVPNTFFKYYPLNDNAVDSLTHTYIYASHPYQLNDLFDCNEFLLDFDYPESVRYMLNNISEYANLSDEELLCSDNKYLAQRGFKEFVYRKIGIFSMTSNPDNLLMWAHYTNNCGFCIEYDISKFGFRYYGPFPINYQKMLPSVQMSKINDAHLAMLVQSNLKQSIWKYEDEWRLLVEELEGADLMVYGDSAYKQLGGHERKFSIPIDAIKKIRLGMSFFDFTERVPSLEEIEITDECVFKLHNTGKAKLKQRLLDFVSVNNIPVEYTMINSIDSIVYIPMLISKSDDSKDEYKGVINKK